MDPQSLASRLPPALSLGVATASTQIEGAVGEDGRGPSIWDTFASRPGRIADGSTPEVACDHYHRMSDDVALLAELGVEVYRFSVSWPRILPEGRGAVEERGLAFYDRLVDALLTAGIEPLPTLYRWDLPQALEPSPGALAAARAGVPLSGPRGWPDRDTAGRFADYAHLVAGRLGDRVRRWATLDEPWCTAHLGYHAGVHAPGRRDAAEAMAAAYTLLRAHHLGDQAIRAAAPGASVGVVCNLTTIWPHGDDDADAVRSLDAIRNRWWLDGFLRGVLPDDAVAAWERLGHPDIRDGDLSGGRPDWLGVSYHSPEVVTAGGGGEVLPDAGAEPARAVPPRGEDVTAMGRRIDPSGLRALLERIGTEYDPVPIAITGNGAAFDDEAPREGRVRDPRRVEFLAAHLGAVADAVDAGVSVTDYMAWSLMDGFEWAHGYGTPVGLVHVDHATQVRTPKDSARWYAELIQVQRARRR